MALDRRRIVQRTNARTSPTDAPLSPTMVVVVDSHSPKRQRVDSPRDPTENGHLVDPSPMLVDVPDSPSTKPPSLSLSPEPDKPLPPLPHAPIEIPRRATRNNGSLQARTTIQTPSKLKAETTSAARSLTTETPHPPQEPFDVQGNCRPMQKKNRDYPMCMACISRQLSSGGCKFASLRAFSKNDFTRPMFVDSAPFLGRKQREAEREIEIAYSTPGTICDIALLRSNIAPTLISVLALELGHETVFRDDGLLRRRREAGVRPVCDGCATTIFSGHFMCCCCGREICLDCYSEWDDSLDVGWENVDSCSKRRRHTKRQMIPFTLFDRGELERLLKDVRSFPLGKDVSESIPPSFPRAQTEGYLPFAKVSVDDISEDDFQMLWRLGEPIVLTNCLQLFQMSWTPQHFIEKYDTVKCMLVNCKTDKTVVNTVGSFFRQFLSTDEPKKPLKLKVPFRCS